MNLGGWDVLPRDNGVHVLPARDVIGHEQGPDCICVPHFEQAGSGVLGRLYVHHSLDGRELHE